MSMIKFIIFKMLVIKSEMSKISIVDPQGKLSNTRNQNLKGFLKTPCVNKNTGFLAGNNNEMGAKMGHLQIPGPSFYFMLIC